MDQKEIEQTFLSMIENYPKTSLAVLAVKMLTDVLSRSQEKTFSGIDKELKEATKIMKTALTTKSNYVGSTIPLISGCELFLKYISKKLDPYSLEADILAAKKEFVERGKQITNLSQKSKTNIAQFLAPFIRDNMVSFPFFFLFSFKKQIFSFKKTKTGNSCSWAFKACHKHT